jgi:C4-dicarboxylate transporter, DctQ subunit
MNGNKWDKWLITGAEIVCSLFLLLIAGLTFGQVIMRYVFNYPLIWSEELSIAAFIYLGFIGIGAGYARGKHLWVDALLVVLPRSIRKVIDIIILALSSAFLLIVISLTAKVMIATIKIGNATAAMQLPMWVIYLSLPIGCVLFLIQVLRGFRKIGRQN